MLKTAARLSPARASSRGKKQRVLSWISSDQGPLLSGRSTTWNRRRSCASWREPSRSPKSATCCSSPRSSTSSLPRALCSRGDRAELNPPVKVIAPGGDAVRQGYGFKIGALERRIADQYTAGAKQRRDQWDQRGGEPAIGGGIAGAGIEMRQRDPAAKPGASRRQGLAHIAEDQPLGRRHAIGMRRHRSLADKDVARRKQLPQMVVSPAVAEPQFEHRAVKAGDQPGGVVEAGALCLEPADKAVEPAHALACCAGAPSRRRL